MRTRMVVTANGGNLTRSGSVVSRPRFGCRQQPIHVSQVVARWWRGGGEVVALRRQNQVRQLKDTWLMGLLYL
jgi:hypothetical protein